ncbi:hypothetical protein F441_14191 [Phytophthora nicotianae CJ01A1]|uniref:Uncharacterized protein n=2 Tax=Phytophthora nicotianae TaxID=4792 RepID=W2MV29_PHYNI|nr:hypothetical protein L915_13938 [Phytophthora nicotianae]ETM40232.1 hypothetical protein L914_13760 [Phytophthora nicotianae]ETP10080.1 hypothetical protein F441_14191 [Phytophthora nicotianae CJ01A1]
MERQRSPHLSQNRTICLRRRRLQCGLGREKVP